MAKIDVSRYAEDPSCSTPEGLRDKMLSDLLPMVNMMGLQRNRCIVATYIRPGLTQGGIIIPGMTQEEDRWQGKVGLLLAVGPEAFGYDEVRAAIDAAVDDAREDAGLEFSEDDEREATGRALRDMNVPRVGDWVAYRTSETHEVGIPAGSVNAHDLASCRFITDDCIVTRLEDPRVIY